MFSWRIIQVAHPRRPNYHQGTFAAKIAAKAHSRKESGRGRARKRPLPALADAMLGGTTRPRGGPRMAVPFRVYPAPSDNDEPLSEPLVHIRFGDLLPLVAVAM